MINSSILKRVLITGANRGIGYAIQQLLANDASYQLVCPTRKEMDLGDPKSIRQFLVKDSAFDILINVAGMNVLGGIGEITEETASIMNSVNLEAPLWLIQGVLPHMKAHRYGRIVNFSSIWGLRSKERRTLYSMAKFGINGLTKALCRELGEYNILVNSVCPGYVNTDMTKANISADEKGKLESEIPLRRFAAPEEIAKLVRFLISEDNTYLTGQNVVIDGGFLA